VSQAQIEPKNSFLIRGNAPYALQRIVADSTFLQQGEGSRADAEARGNSHSQQQVRFLTPMKNIQEVDVLQNFRFCK